MSTPIKPEIIVEITLSTTESGGRTAPIQQGEYRGILSVGEDSFSVRFFVPLKNGMTPSQTQRFGVQFLAPEAALQFFSVGTNFTVWEGRVIGHGKVLEVLPHAE